MFAGRRRKVLVMLLLLGVLSIGDPSAPAVDGRINRPEVSVETPSEGIIFWRKKKQENENEARVIVKRAKEKKKKEQSSKWVSWAKFWE